MKFQLIALLAVFAIPCQAQYGYVKTFGDSTHTGYLRNYTSTYDGHRGIELWRTKKDRSPRRFAREHIEEYAVKKDTFKILHQFTPFEESKTYFELVEAKRKVSGRINLYIIANYGNPNRVSSYTMGGLIPFIIDECMENHSFMYILEERETGHLKAVPARKEELTKVLIEFFPEEYMARYAGDNGKIRYRSIPELVAAYNSAEGEQ